MADSRDDFIIAIRYALLKKGAKQKFSLFFLILLSLAIITLDKFSHPATKVSRAVINDVVYHISAIANTPIKGTKNFFKTLGNFYFAYSENKNLKKEIESLNNNKFNTIFLKTENRNLKNYLKIGNLKRVGQSINIFANVFFDQNSPYLKSLIINRGTKNGVAKGMTVFSQNFLIGTVIETNYQSARILLLTDLNSKIPVVIEGTKVQAILSGNGKKNGVFLEYLPDKYELGAEKIIFTSGKDGFLLPGIPVAKTLLNKKGKIILKVLAEPNQAIIVRVTSSQNNSIK